ncbi:EDD domain protein, DegV family [Alkalibacterium subtropicum]|uniref:EDD domain protein, DegV family n=1 Tax=Alkalibacterium subtropicum TaxID=753702 RepID=A0A1I1EIT7_9LACT|nr:DegV family protein [Alkalibacterium subtropicum]SFB87059.1 EDD domain protein, DegV family [Alkalibacterium subtropicum]
MNYQIITDSCSDLPLELVDQYNLDIVHFTIRIGDEDIVDDMGENFDKEAFFQRLKEGETASTSQVNVHSYLEKFKYYIEKEIPVLYLAFSSALSGSFNSAVQAKKMLEEEYGEVDIDIIDTKGASLGQGILVYEASQKQKEGFTKEELMDWVEKNKLHYHSWVTVDDIKHLQRGGRISSTAATVGSLLHVKPILIMNTEGKLVPAAKVRGRKKSINYLIDQTVSHLTDPEDHSIFIGHVGVPDEAKAIRDKILERVSPKEVVVSSYGPTVAAHTGFGSIAVFSYGDTRSD